MPDKPKLLKVSFSNQHSRDFFKQTFVNSKRQNKLPVELKNYYLLDDLTKIQLQKMKDLRMQVQNSGDTRRIIKKVGAKIMILNNSNKKKSISATKKIAQPDQTNNMTHKTHSSKRVKRMRTPESLQSQQTAKKQSIQELDRHQSWNKSMESLLSQTSQVSQQEAGIIGVHEVLLHQNMGDSLLEIS